MMGRSPLAPLLWVSLFGLICLILVNGFCLRISAQFTSPLLTIAGTSQPISLATDSACQNLFVLDFFGEQVLKIDLVHNQTVGPVFTANPSLLEPVGVKVDGTSNVYVLDYNRIVKFNSAGTQVATLFPTGASPASFNKPAGLAVDSSGQVYVLDGLNNRIVKFNSAGNYASSFSSATPALANFNLAVVNNNHGLTVDAQDNVWFTVSQAPSSTPSAIVKFSSNGTLLSILWNVTAPLSLLAPEGLAVDGQGNVWVIDSVNGASVLSANNGSTLQSIPSATTDAVFMNAATNTVFVISITRPAGFEILRFNVSGLNVTSLGFYLAPVSSGENQFALPTAIAVDSGNNIYWTQKYVIFSNAIIKWTQSTGTLSNWVLPFSQPPFSMIIDGSDFMWILDQNSGIWRIDTRNWNITNLWNVSSLTTPPLLSPSSFFLTPDASTIIISNGSITAVGTLNPNGPNSPFSLQRTAGLVAQVGLGYPSTFVYDQQAGRSYVIDASGQSRIAIFDNNVNILGYLTGAYGRSFSALSGVGLDKQGQLYVCDFNNLRVVVFDRNGNAIGNYTSPNALGFFSCLDVAIDSNGRVIFAEAWNRVTIFPSVSSPPTPPASTGGGIVTSSTGGSITTSISGGGLVSSSGPVGNGTGCSENDCGNNNGASVLANPNLLFLFVILSLAALSFL